MGICSSSGALIFSWRKKEVVGSELRTPHIYSAGEKSTLSEVVFVPGTNEID